MTKIQTTFRKYQILIKNKRKSLAISISLGVLAPAVVSFMGLFSTGLAQAACSTSPNAANGTDTLSITVPSTGTYYLWTQMLAPDTTNNTVFFQLDPASSAPACYLVGGSNIPANTWTWENKDNTGTSIALTNVSSGTHQVVLTGSGVGVGVGRILLLSDPPTTCTPTSTGDNCTTTAPTPSVSFTTPSNGATVSGTTNITSSASESGGSIANVQYQLDGTNLGSALPTSPYSFSWNTASVSNGSHTLTAIATDGTGKTATATISVTVNNLSPPTVSITAPTSGSTVTGTTSVTANASETGGTIANVQFKLDGVNLGTADTSAPYSTSWDTSATANGSHTLTAVATDTTSHSTTSSSVSVTVNNISAPTVSITAPINGSTVTGTTSVTANASESGGTIANVQFKLDGVNLGSADTTSPYSTSWDTTATANGSHILTAVVTDTTGHSATSSNVSVTVNNVASFSCSGSTALICEDFSSTAEANNFTTTGGTWSISGGQYNLTSPIGTGSQSGLLNIALHKTAITGDFTMTFNGMVSGSNTFRDFGAAFDYKDANNYYAIELSEADDSGTNGIFKIVSGVQTKIADFPSLSSANTWYGVKITKSGSTITVYRNNIQLATATDSTFIQGQIGLGSRNDPSSFSALVLNGSQLDTTPPSVTMTAPSSGASVSGTTTVSANATDNFVPADAVNVQFVLDEGSSGIVNLGNPIPTSPYNYSWDTTSVPNGTYSLYAVASDTAGNSTTSSPVSVTVFNAPVDTTPPTAPTNLTAQAVSTSQINLNWGAATDNVSIAGYKVYRNNTLITTLNGSTLSFGDSGLAQGTSYSYYVVAFDSAGNLSAHSNSATATTQSTVTTATVEGVMFDASTNNPLVGARATVGSRSGATISQSTTNSQGQYLLSGITPNHTYHYTYVDNHYFNSGFYLAYPAGTNIKNVGLTHK